MLGITSSFAQTNLVPNPSFEDILDCNFDYGAADNAPPWGIIDFPIASPDLFHACAISPFYQVPLADPIQVIFPKSGDAMVGMVNLIPVAEEKIYARLLEDLPTDVDIYVAFSTIPRSKSGGVMETLCYSNTQSMAFSDIQFQIQSVALEVDDILDNTQEWTQLQSCYQASGEEKYVLLGNYKLASQELRDCDFTDTEFNFSYYFVDDVIVAPFDVIPDTLYICGDDFLEMDVNFFEVPISWNDGVEGGARIIEEGGIYKVMGNAGGCFLEDETLVIKIPDETETISLILCDEEELILETPFLSEWSSGEIGRSILINRAGTYTANMMSDCGERLRIFEVEEMACDIQYFVPNVFSPNDDGVNDELEFFFKSDFEFSGELNVLDRWGNLLYNNKNISSINSVSWDGTFKDKPLDPAVFVWVFRYTSAKDGRSRVISGDFTLVK